MDTTKLVVSCNKLNLTFFVRVHFRIFFSELMHNVRHIVQRHIKMLNTQPIFKIFALINKELESRG